MTDEQLQKANDLRSIIKNLETFRYAIRDNRKSNYHCCAMWITKKTITYYRMFSFFDFKIGHRKESISIPDHLYVEIRELVDKKIDILEKELSEL